MIVSRMSAARRFLDRFAADNRGATAVEYGLIVALIFLVIVTAIVALGSNVGASFQNTSDAVVSAGG